MALITTAASGNWNDTATWTGGVIPTVGDTARIGGAHTVTITANAACDFIEQVTTVTGSFVLNSGVTLTATVRGRGTSANPVLRYVGTGTANLIGNVVSLENQSSFVTVRHNGTGTLNITGNIGGAASTASSNGNAVVVDNGGTLNVTGNIGPVGGSSSNRGLIVTGANSTATITGNVSSDVNSGSALAVDQNATVTINGTVTGATVTTNATNISVGATGTLTVNGNVFGGTAVSSSAVAIYAEGLLTINGNITAGPVASSNGVTLGGAISAANNFGRATITGTITASEQSHALELSSTNAAVTISGPVVDSPTGRSAIYSRGRVRISNPATFTDSRRTGAYTYVAGVLQNGTAVTLIDNTINTPAPADVRTGVSYAAGTRTGTCAVPPAAAVSVGVPVGATVGTAATTAADIATLVGAQIAAAVTAP